MDAVWTYLFLIAFAATLPEPAENVLSVQVVPHKNTIILGEPLIVTTTVTNTGPDTLKVVYQNAPTLSENEFCVVQLLLGRPGEPLTYPEVERNRWSDELRILGRMPPLVLEANKQITIDLVMLYRLNRGFFVHKPGKYWLSGLVFFHSQPTNGGSVQYRKFIAPPIEIEVRDPSPNDKEDWEWLNSQGRNYGRLVQTPWEAQLPDEFLSECGKRFATSQSPYAEYVALFLGRWYHEGPKKNAQEIKRWANIASRNCSSEKMLSEAKKLRH